MWSQSHSYTRAILHVDGDGFFAACEVAKNPLLRGKAVITGKERGIVSACTYEAKARGVRRGMRLFQVRKICPDAVILPSDYESYSLFSRRMYEIVRRYTPAVEVYSIDECFADLTGMRRVNHLSYPQMAARIKRDLATELGISFSVGLSATKVLAKVASKWHKPNGLTIIPLCDAEQYLAKVAIEAIWGIGPNTAAYLGKFGIETALDFAKRDKAWVCRTLSKPYIEIWHELNGEVKNELDVDGRATYQSISKTKTFTPPSSNLAFVYAQLSKNVENACIKARRWHLASPEVLFFLKTQDFKYRGCEIKLSHPTSVPQDILKEIAKYFPRVFERGVPYRATGITLLKLAKDAPAQLDLFGSVEASEKVKCVFESVDKISERYGKHAVFLGSSFQAINPSTGGRSLHLGERGDVADRATNLFRGETRRRRLGIPMLGEVS